MKKRLFYCFIVAVSGMIFSCAPQGPNNEEMIAAAKALDQQFIDAYNNLDVDGVMACYWNSPELVSYPPGNMVEHGPAEVKHGLTDFFNSVPALKLELTETHYKVVGDAVLGWGLWHMEIPTPDGQSMEMNGRFLDVKAKRDGKWVYIIDHASVPLPPPPDAPEK